jgi:roadblock/LC7 domain-containing protein
MTELERLLELPGALAAFRFDTDGALRAHLLRDGTGMTPLMLELLARSCIANQAMAGMEARGWEVLTGQAGFQPLVGLSVIGLEWSVVTGGHVAVVVRNRDADYEAAFAALQKDNAA